MIFDDTKPTFPTHRCRDIYVPSILLAASLLLVSLGYAWMLDVVPQYFKTLSCLRILNQSFLECVNQTTAQQQSDWNNVTADADNQSSLVGLCLALTQLFTCPILCTFGDSIGRKPVLIFMSFFTSLYFWGFALIPKEYLYTYGPYLAVLSGIGGGIYAYLAALFASIADLTAQLAPKERTIFFGLVEANVWIGLAVGPLISEFVVNTLAPLKDAHGIRQSFFVGAGLQTTGMLILFFMKESLVKKKKITWASINPLAGLLNVKSYNIALIITSNALMLIGTSVGMALIPFYLSSKVYFNYSDSSGEFAEQSNFMSIYFAASGAGLLLVLPLVTKCFSQKFILLLSNIAVIVTWSLFGVPKKVWQLYPIAALCICNGLLYPVTRTFVTRHFGRKNYGNALGILALLQAFSSIIAPVLQRVFWNIQLSVPIRGLIFFFIGGFALLGLLCNICIHFPKDEAVPGAATPTATPRSTLDHGLSENTNEEKALSNLVGSSTMTERLLSE